VRLPSTTKGLHQDRTVTRLTQILHPSLESNTHDPATAYVFHSIQTSNSIIMPSAGGRFGQQLLSGPFSQHLPNSHLQHHPGQHQTPPSAGLPPPSFNPHQPFTHSTPNSALNPFAPTNGTNGLAAGFGGGGGIGAGGTGLASQAAVLGFAHGAVMQQQQAARDALRRSSGTGKAQSKNRIRDVWQGNLAQEMATIRELVDRYPYISMVRAIYSAKAELVSNY